MMQDTIKEKGYDEVDHILNEMMLMDDDHHDQRDDDDDDKDPNTNTLHSSLSFSQTPHTNTHNQNTFESPMEQINDSFVDTTTMASNPEITTQLPSKHHMHDSSSSLFVNGQADNLPLATTSTPSWSSPSNPTIPQPLPNKSNSTVCHPNPNSQITAYKNGTSAHNYSYTKPLTQSLPPPPPTSSFVMQCTTPQYAPFASTYSYPPPYYCNNNHGYNVTNLKLGYSYNYSPPSFVTSSSYLPFSMSCLPKQRQRAPPPQPPKQKILRLVKQPMELPSPYATTHEIISHTIVILKEKNGSFGVNVKFDNSVTALVDPSFIMGEKEQKKEGAGDAKKNTAGLEEVKKKESDYNIVPKNENVVVKEENAAVTDAMRQQKVAHHCQVDSAAQVQVDAANIPDFSIKQEKPLAHALLQSTPTLSTTNTVTNPSNLNNVVIVKEENLSTQAQLSIPLSTNTSLTIASSATTTSSNASSSLLAITTQEDGKANKETTTPFVLAPKKRKKRRRRVPFGVLMVVDATKQNSQWGNEDEGRKKDCDDDDDDDDDNGNGKNVNDEIKEESGMGNVEHVVGRGENQAEDQKKQADRGEDIDATNMERKENENGEIKKKTPPVLLESGDVILSINGEDVGGLTFGEACALFSRPPPPSSSRMVADATDASVASEKNIANEDRKEEEEEDVVRCVLVVARRRKEFPKKEKKKKKKKEKKITKDKKENMGGQGEDEDRKDINKEVEKEVAGKKATVDVEKKVSCAAIEPTVDENTQSKSSSSVLPGKEVAEATPPIVPSPPPPPAPTISLTTVEKRGNIQITSGEFSNTELCAFLNAMLYVQHPRFFKKEQHFSMIETMLRAIKTHPTHGPALKHRTVQTLIDRWTIAGLRYEQDMASSADLHWKQEWHREIKYVDDNGLGGSEEDKSRDLLYLPDSKRSELRALPRPAVGCKCGSSTHSYVNDEDCILYRNLRVLEDETANEEDEGSKINKDNGSTKGKKRRKKDDKNNKMKKIRTVESAYVEKFKRIQAEMDAERDEAEFVTRMEGIQINQERKAIFAPNTLSLMIICAVAYLKEQMMMLGDDDTAKFLDSATNKIDENEEDLPEVEEDTDFSSDGENSSDEEDEDNTPLTALGSSKQQPIKRQGRWQRPHPFFMGEIMVYISKTWGHVYVEPSNLDYAWHCKNLTEKYGRKKQRSGDELNIKNPRNQHERSFENIQFILTQEMQSSLKEDWMSSPQLQEKATCDSSADGVNTDSALPSDAESLSTDREINALNKKDKIKKQSLDALLLTYLASDFKTGLYKELQSLTDMGVLDITSRGAIMLAPDWYNHVDQSILNDIPMVDGTGLDRYCIHKTVRETLSNIWIRNEIGWARNVEENSGAPKHIDVYDDETYEWRRKIFEERYEAYNNDLEGIGQFGI